ncbi:MAG: LON peptidase substrate-binding domain-containing protein [Gammaproteobacteria bacterium]|nr:LON peptidase substrate-binding domain-containing protein [Gammaproteobacteria bacterium]
MTTVTQNIALFPLSTVLYPDGPLPLRVFEPRYLDMVSRCMKQNVPFGVLMLLSGSEMGDAMTATIGTSARIIDWYQGSDGILGITAVGEQRFRLNSIDRQPDGLYIGEVEFMEAEPAQSIPEEYKSMSALLEVVVSDLGKLYEGLELNYDDASWVGRRFAEVLPLSLEQKQHCLEMNDALERLKYLRPLLSSIRHETRQ